MRLEKLEIFGFIGLLFMFLAGFPFRLLTSQAHKNGTTMAIFIILLILAMSFFSLSAYLMGKKHKNIEMMADNRLYSDNTFDNPHLHKIEVGQTYLCIEQAGEKRLIPLEPKS